MIVIVDYGMGNLGSIANMVRKIGGQAVISSDTRAIESADQVILPGVGAFDMGMRNLHDRELITPLCQAVLHRKTPVLGICLGMQLLTRSSEEGQETGLGWIDGRTIRFQCNGDSNLKVPHMGWNTVTLPKDSPLFCHMPVEPRFYFVHSYYPVCHHAEEVTALARHGHEFVAAFQRDNIFGVQFHPEKSHKFGMQLLRNFLSWRAGNTTLDPTREC
jgi:glutamine amidotransferase